MKLIFESTKLQPIIKMTMEAKKFLIPYEGEKISKNRTIWMVTDAGVYICPSLPGLKYPLKEKDGTICYAIGWGPTTHYPGSDGIEEIKLSAEMASGINKGYNLGIEFDYEFIKITLHRPK